MTNHHNITNLDEKLLSTVIPTCTYGGGPIENPSGTFFIWRSCKTETMTGGTLGFYLDDWRLDALWRHPAQYAKQFKECGVVGVAEVDFSLWSDMSLAEQVENVYRMRTVSRVFQSYDLRIVPNLSWSDERSFEFAFSGIPIGAAICATEARTAGQNDEDRRRFIAGLTEAVKQVKPQHIVVYGGIEHRHWLTGNLPEGPQYTLIEAFMTARGKIRKTQERKLRERNQLSLFGGNNGWVEEEVQAA